MPTTIILLTWIFIVCTTAIPMDTSRIIGGEVVDIAQYPYAVVMLRSVNLVTYSLACGGSVITSRAVLTAAHCFFTASQPAQWRVRVGSTFANSGGTVHNAERLTPHENVSTFTLDNDIAVLRTETQIVFNTQTQPVTLPSLSYRLNDDQEVYAIGWGRTAVSGSVSEELRHVQVWVVNQNICRQRYSVLNYGVTENMLCSGWLDVGGRDQCQGDSGGALVHKNEMFGDVIVGICSWGESCALAEYPGVNVRVSNYANWLLSNVN